VSLAYVGSQRVGGDRGGRLAHRAGGRQPRLQHLRRGADGLLTLLTPELVLSKAPTSIESQEYTLTVTTAANTIWLEDISLDGVTELHGPFVVGESVGDPNPPAPIDWTPAQAEPSTRTAGGRAPRRPDACPL
jgi:hypothetical protein